MHHFRNIFILANGLLLTLFGLYIWQQREQSYKNLLQDLSHRNHMIAASTRSSLISMEALLREVGWKLLDLGTLEDPDHGRAYIKQLSQGHPPVIGYGLMRTNGTPIISTGMEGGRTLPNLLQTPEAADSFRRTLASNTLQLGMPYYLDSFKKWIIPIRIALKDEAGNNKAVMVAGLRINGANTIWEELNAGSALHRTKNTRQHQPLATTSHQHAHLTSIILHGDGYVQYYGCNVSSEADLKRTYNGKYYPDVRAGLSEFRGGSGTKVLKASKFLPPSPTTRNEDYITAYNYLPRFNLYVFTAYQYTDWNHSFFLGLLPQCFGYLFLVLMTLIAYYYNAEKQKALEQQIAYIARHDELTGLPNKTRLLDRMAPMISISRRENMKCAVAVLNISNLSHINQTSGLEFGNSCLLCISERYQSGIREGDSIAKIGGETFALFFPHLHSEEEATDTAERMLALISSPLFVDNIDTTIEGRLGVAIYPNDADSPESLVNAASLACDIAKKHGSNTIVRYTPCFQNNVPRRARIEHALSDALKTEELEVYYQPKIDCADGKCTNFEALARWHSPDFGTIPPEEFIRIAEETGIIDKLGLYVLNRAIADMKALELRTGRALNVAVNVSAKQFLTNALPSFIEETLHKHDFPGSRLTIELTESLMIIDRTHVTSMLNQIRELGIRISVDDFGTGYSSLSYIHKLPVSELKIDRSFVMDIAHDAGDRALVKSIIALGKSLGVHIVAEGVETQDHVEILSEYGCDQLQGYYYSPPRPIGDIIDYVIKHNMD